MVKKPKIRWATPEEWKQTVNQRSLRNFGCTVDEFLDGFLLGSYDIDGPQHSALVETLMLVDAKSLRARKKALANARRALTRLIQECCDPNEGLLSKKIIEKKPRFAHPTMGCCYIAAEALYYMWGKARGFKPYYARYVYIPSEHGPAFRGIYQDFKLGMRRKVETHWYLMNRDGVVLDPTGIQFGPSSYAWRPDYKNGTCCGFQQMKNETHRLLERMRSRCENIVKNTFGLRYTKDQKKFAEMYLKLEQK